MKDWNDREIRVARSKGGVLVTSHPFENLVSTGIVPWPTPEVVQKLYQSNQSKAFDEQNLAIAAGGIGHYCDLQSIHSEDAITWSVFGTLAYSDAEARNAWVSRLLALCLLGGVHATNSSVCLWREGCLTRTPWFLAGRRLTAQSLPGTRWSSRRPSGCPVSAANKGRIKTRIKFN